MLHHRTTGSERQPPQKRRMLAAAVGAGGLVGIIVTGLVLTVADMTSPGRDAGVGSSIRQQKAVPKPVSEEIGRKRDELAARPMPDTGTGHEYGRPDLSTRDPGAPIVLPRSRGTGARGVQTGYSHTPEGALAQLAAIDVAALRSASMAGARAVIREWAAPGGPSIKSWSGVKAMASLLESAGIATDGTARVNVEAIPEMGLIKGTVGDDFVVACVDLTVDITFGGTSRTVAADCQRLVWTGERWMIGPGREPAQPTSVWPGTDAAIDAGFKDLLFPEELAIMLH
jgi:hypothetical protein